VTFWVGSVWVSELWFGSTSGQSIFGPICLSYKNKQLCRKFRFGYGSIHVNSGPLSGEPISDVESGMGLGSSVRVLGLRLVLLGLVPGGPRVISDHPMT